MKSFRIAAAVVLLATVPSLLHAQSFERVVAEETIRWTPPAGTDGIESTIRGRIVYDAMMGEPTRLAVARVTLGDAVHYEGVRYTRAEVGEETWKVIEKGVLDLEADVYQGTRRVSTVRFNNVTSGDIAGSPNWDEVFPGVSAESAKQVYRDGFTIRNMRVAALSFVGMYAMERFVDERERRARYDAAVARADRHYDAGRLDEALAAYREAAPLAPPGEGRARTRIDEIRERQADDARRAREAEQARAAEAARAEAEAERAAEAREQAAQTARDDAAARQQAARDDAAAAQAEQAERARAQAEATAEAVRRRQAEAERQRRENAEAHERSMQAIAAGGIYVGAFTSGEPIGESIGGSFGMIDKDLSMIISMSANDLFGDPPADAEEGEIFYEKRYMQLAFGKGFGQTMFVPYLGLGYDMWSASLKTGPESFAHEFVTDEDVSRLTAVFGAVGRFGILAYQVGLDLENAQLQYGLGFQF